MVNGSEFTSLTQQASIESSADKNGPCRTPVVSRQTDWYRSNSG